MTKESPLGGSPGGVLTQQNAGFSSQFGTGTPGREPGLKHWKNETETLSISFLELHFALLKHHPSTQTPAKLMLQKRSQCKQHDSPPKPIPTDIFRQLYLFSPVCRQKAELQKPRGCAPRSRLAGFQRGVWSWLPPPGAATSISWQGGGKDPDLIPVPQDPAPQSGSLHQAPAPFYPPVAALSAGWARRPQLLPRTPKPPIVGADLQRPGDPQDPASSLCAAK